jgi:hypothetical protein
MAVWSASPSVQVLGRRAVKRFDSEGNMDICSLPAYFRHRQTKLRPRRIHFGDCKVCSSFLNLASNKNTFRFLDLSGESRNRVRMQAQEEYVHKYLQPQAPKKWQMEWPDSVTRARRAATRATPRIIFRANSNLSQNPEKITELAREGLKKCWGNSSRKCLTDHAGTPATLRGRSLSNVGCCYLDRALNA